MLTLACGSGSRRSISPAGHAEFPLAVTFSLAARGRGSTQARLALGPVAIVADSIGVQATWSPSTAFDVGLAAPGLGVDTGIAVIPLVLPTVDSAGHVSVPPDAWRSVEMLVGVLAASANSGWLSDLVDLVGWQLGGRPRGPKLSLGGLVAEPDRRAARLAGRARHRRRSGRHADVDAGALDRRQPDGLAGVFSGSGTPDDPWLAALGGSASLPAIAVWMGPSRSGRGALARRRRAHRLAARAARPRARRARPGAVRRGRAPARTSPTSPPVATGSPPG